MGMNPTLAAAYNTLGAGEAYREEATKVAHLEMFAKAATANGFDLSQMDQQTVAALYDEYSSKLAQEMGEDEEDEEDEEDGEEDGEEEKEAAARREWLAQKEWHEKNAQVDFLGRRMAHSFWDEYNQITKESSRIGDAARSVGRGVKGLGRQTAEGAREVGSGLKRSIYSRLGKIEDEAVRNSTRRAGARKIRSGVKKLAPAAGTAAGVGALGAGGAYALSRRKGGGGDEGEEESKEGSAFDFRAAQQAVKLASAAGWDEDEVVDRLNAVLTLGPGESEKIAYGNLDFDDALNVRGLELMEVAGYPVNWNSVFGE